MTTIIERSITVGAPLSTVYNQWTRFEEFPRFMSGIEQVTQVEDDQLQWVANIGGVRRQWKAQVLEQVPDQKVAWAATEGATNAGSVTFEDAGSGQTIVHLRLEYDPEGFLENVGDKLHVVHRQTEQDLQHFKSYMESHGRETGAWRGAVNEGSQIGAGLASGGDLVTPGEPETGPDIVTGDPAAGSDLTEPPGETATTPPLAGDAPVAPEGI